MGVSGLRRLPAGKKQCDVQPRPHDGCATVATKREHDGAKPRFAAVQYSKLHDLEMGLEAVLAA